MYALLLPHPCWPAPQATLLTGAQAKGTQAMVPPHALQGRRRRALTLGLSLLLSGCMLRPLHSGQETQIDSQMPGQQLAAGVQGQPFCLHVRFRNHFFPAYSDGLAEAWITDGSCESKGPPRNVRSLRLSWWHDWQDTQATRQCLNLARCSAAEEHIVLSRNIRCVAAHAIDGPHSAFITTDQTVCH